MELIVLLIIILLLSLCLSASSLCAKMLHYDKGLIAKKHVFGVSDKVRFKPACSATETS